MKDNLRAKFYDNIKKASIEEFPEIQEIDFVVDKNIENPSNTDVIDCSQFFKEFNKKGKKSHSSHDGDDSMSLDLENSD
jgi:hypothetical protein